MGEVSKFRYYITSMNDGSVQGTNEREVAEELATQEDLRVIDAETGELLTNDWFTTIGQYSKVHA